MSKKSARTNVLLRTFGCFAAVLAAGCGSPKELGEPCNAITGDLVISELMVNPKGEERRQEWIELYNTSTQSIILNRLIFEGRRGDDFKEWRVTDVPDLAPKSYVVFGNGYPDIAPIDYSFRDRNGTNGFMDLNNTSGILRVRCQGDVVDEVTYGEEFGVPLPDEGASLSFDGGAAPDAALNDRNELWCAGDTLYDEENYGTPGAPNGACGYATCTDGTETRDVVNPSAGELVISEVFSDAAGSDADKEWIEVYVGSGSTIDFNGLEIVQVNPETGSTRRARVESNACLPASPGSYIVLGSSLDPALNGGVPVDFEVPDLSLLSSDTTTLELRLGAELIDQAVLPEPSAGISISLAPGRVVSGQNDTASSFCDAISEGNFGRGTPGAPNDPCGWTCMEDGSLRDVNFPGEGDLVISEVFADPSGADGDKEWVELYVAGSSAVDLNGLFITSTKLSSGSSSVASVAQVDCAVANPGAFVVIGRAMDPSLTGGVSVTASASELSFYNDAETSLTIEVGGDVIDQAVLPPSSGGRSASLDPLSLTPNGNDDPTSFCDAKSTWEFEGTTSYGTPGSQNDSCGEVCRDGSAFRPKRAPTTGDLVITEVYADPDNPSADNNREWIEIYVAATSAVDLNGLVIDNTNATPTTRSFNVQSDDCIVGAPGAYLLVGGENASLDGVVLDATLDSFSLYNSESSVSLMVDSQLLDSITYSAGPAGASFALDPFATTPAANDELSNWCTSSTSSASFAGLGTPGQGNPACGS